MNPTGNGREVTDIAAESVAGATRVAELIARTRSRARACLLASRLCLLALIVAFACGALLFSWANKLVNVPVSLSPATNISISGDGKPIINVDQKVQKETADSVLDLDWKNRVLNQAAAFVARLGVVLLLIFLMQFAMRLFRYYHAAHLFFLARAEALFLSTPKAMDLETALRFLSPQGVDFGGLPRSPLDSLVSGAKAALAATKE